MPTLTQPSLADLLLHQTLMQLDADPVPMLRRALAAGADPNGAIVLPNATVPYEQPPLKRMLWQVCSKDNPAYTTAKHTHFQAAWDLLMEAGATAASLQTQHANAWHNWVQVHEDWLPEGVHARVAQTLHRLNIPWNIDNGEGLTPLDIALCRDRFDNAQKMQALGGTYCPHLALIRLIDLDPEVPYDVQQIERFRVNECPRWQWYAHAMDQAEDAALTLPIPEHAYLGMRTPLSVLLRLLRSDGLPQETADALMQAWSTRVIDWHQPLPDAPEETPFEALSSLYETYVCFGQSMASIEQVLERERLRLQQRCLTECLVLAPEAPPKARL